ncbi:MAG: MBL fold metallo-hydrolase [Coriobacteriia bacterium]|nr:MBL fold metallo-hydrolase [Coriobacteriia bacterium]
MSFWGIKKPAASKQPKQKKAPGQKQGKKAQLLKDALVGICMCCLLATAISVTMGCAEVDSSDDSSDEAQTEVVDTSGDASSEQADAQDDAKEASESKAKATTSSSQSKQAKSEKLLVKFVDVGQGDASLIEFPDGKTMLIDTADGGSSEVVSTLRADKRTKIDYLVATHPDADHIGGLASVITSVKVASVWMPKATSSTKTYQNLLETIDSQGLSINTCYAGRKIASGKNYTAELLWPEKSAKYFNSNDYSAVVKLTYGKNTFLFTGDAPVEAESQCVSASVDVLKVSHHGSASGTNASLAKKLSPKIAVLSYGKNSYGHPTQVVLDALNSVDAQVFGTYVNGTVTVTSDGTKVKASAEKKGKIVAASKNAGASSQQLNSSGAGGGSSGKTSSKGSSDSSGSNKASSKSSASSAKSSSSSSSKSSNSDETVVITPTGSKYHLEGCRTTKRSSHLTKMKKSKAEAQGYTACAVCNP